MPTSFFMDIACEMRARRAQVDDVIGIDGRRVIRIVFPPVFGQRALDRMELSRQGIPRLPGRIGDGGFPEGARWNAEHRSVGHEGLPADLLDQFGDDPDGPGSVVAAEPRVLLTAGFTGTVRPAG